MRAESLTVHRSTTRPQVPLACLLLAALLILPGCVSKRLQTASKKTPPAVPLNLQSQQLPLTTELNTLIVFKGPGSWKREAYWDEYVVSLVNQGHAPVTVDVAVLDSSAIVSQSPGSDPWETEKESHKILKDQTLGRALVAGAGVGMAAIGVDAGLLALGSAAVATGSAAAVAGATVALVALPVLVVGSTIRLFTAPHAIEKEFNRRRLVLPLELKPGEMRQGSLFFPITPGPQHLVLDFRAEGSAPQSLSIDLAPLANLHFAEAPAGGTAPKLTPN
jgi:hypothetical protein